MKIDGAAVGRSMQEGHHQRRKRFKEGLFTVIESEVCQRERPSIRSAGFYRPPI